MKFYTVYLDGIDKSGKDTIAKYVWMLDKRLNVFVRGWPSLVAYAKKFCRDVNYALPYKDALYVHCIVSKEDWQIRCKMTNEQKIDFVDDSKLFDEAFNELERKNYNVMKADTSAFTPYQNALLIVNKMQALNAHSKEEKNVSSN